VLVLHRYDTGFNETGRLGPEVVERDTPTIAYTYNPLTDNYNGRTIQGFSTTANIKYRPFDNMQADFYKDMQKFANYYGAPTFADEWIQAAFSAGSTAFDNANADFSTYDFESRAEAVRMATAFMSTGMVVIRELEDAVDDCTKGCEITECNDGSVSSVDVAVALYTGALEGTDGSGKGNLMYSLADAQCVEFKTCGENGNSATGTSKVNVDVFREFRSMQDNIMAKNCTAARKNKERIAQLFFVPLVQGTLHSAHTISSTANASSKYEIQGATFAAAVLPVVDACSPEDARTIYDNMKTGQGGSPDFATVKASFERNYVCMGITCADVGGVYQTARGTYYAGAEPCSGAGGSGNVNVGLAVGLSICGLAAVIMIVAFIKFRRSTRKAPATEFVMNDNPVA
jgi:hypothetical protein